MIHPNVFINIFSIFEMLSEEEVGNAEVRPASNKITYEGNALSSRLAFSETASFLWTLSFSKP
jgi:hypothetical protein